MTLSLKSSTARLAFNNYVFGDQLDVIGAVASGGSVTNEAYLATPQLSDRCVITGPGSASIVTTLIADLPIDVVGLLNADVTVGGAVAGEWIVEIHNEANELVYGPITVDLVLPPADGFDRHLWHILPATVTGNRITLIFNQTGEEAIDLRAGAVWISELWMTGRGIQDDWSIYPVPRGSNPTSDDGQGYPERKHTLRAVDFTLARFTRAEAFGAAGSAVFDVQRVQHTVDLTEFVVFWPRIAINGVLDPHLIHRLGVYGVFKELGKISHVSGSADEFTAGTMTVEGRR